MKKIRSRLLKSRGAEDRLKTRAELKLFERKLESRRSLENRSFRVYLKIRLLEVECENVNF